MKNLRKSTVLCVDYPFSRLGDYQPVTQAKHGARLFSTLHGITVLYYLMSWYLKKTKNKTYHFLYFMIILTISFRLETEVSEGTGILIFLLKFLYYGLNIKYPVNIMC